MRSRLRHLAPPWLPRLNGTRLDIFLAVLIGLTGSVMGGVVTHAEGQGSYYQRNFGPAVMQACGHGFTSYRDDELIKFLELRSKEYECPDPYVAQLGGPADAFALSERYLFGAASVIWRVAGISWGALLPLFALLFGLTAAGLYGVFRLVSSRPVAVVGCLLVLTSPGYLLMLPNLRDFSKAPFVVIGSFLVGVLVARALSFRAMALVGALFGLTMGIGIGFRIDAITVVPLFMAALALFTPAGIRGAPRARAAALGAFVLAFGVSALPQLLALRDTNGSATLMAVHGATLPFNDELGVEQDLYTPGYLYNDAYAIALVNAHAYRIDGYRKPLELENPQLERYSQSLYLALARNFPADFITRSRASVVRLLELGALSTLQSPTVPPAVDPGGIADRLRNWIGDLLRRTGGAVWLPLAALLVAAVSNLRASLFVLLSVFYVGALSTLQFSGRHIFQFEALWWLAAAFLVERSIRLGIRLWRERELVRRQRPEWATIRGGATRIGIVLVTIAIAGFGAQSVARAYQDPHVESLLERYEQAPRLSVRTNDVPVGRNRTLVRIDNDAVWKGPAGGVQSALFVATFSAGRCTSLAVTPVARYGTSDVAYDWSSNLDVRLNDEAARVEVYFLAFRLPLASFTGIELPVQQRRCLKRIAAVDTDGMPVLLYVTLPQNWRDVTMHATLAGKERRRQVYEHGALVVSSGLVLPDFNASEVTLAGESYTWTRSRYVAEGVRFAGNGWSFDHDVDARYSYLVQGADRTMARGRFAVVHGFVDAGGLTLGLIRDNAWAAIVQLPERGEFYAVLEAPETARYSLTIANNVADDDARNRVRIEVVRWNVPGR